MIDAIVEGLMQLLSPFNFGLLCAGMAMGIVLGILPGIGGMVGLSLLLPFIWELQPYQAMPLMIGLLAVVNTSDTITCVLVGVPGTAGSVATIMDGYPLAQKGEAGRALSAAFAASAIGGVLGAALLALSLPIFRPLVMMLRAPELFMFVILGVVMTGALSGREPLKGLISAGLGLMLASIGGAGAFSVLRYYFGIHYLYGGIPVLLVALGVFGIVEVADLARKGLPIAGRYSLGKGTIDGLKDTLREWALTLRATLLGAYIGFLPGMGSSVANWVAYGHAIQSAKDSSNFGKGDIRGVIAPEAANNACRGGDLIPTLMFGVPGSASMALFLAAMIVLGVVPGPDMVTKHLPLFWNIVWGLAIANVLGALVCFTFTRHLAKLTTINIHKLVPFIIGIIFIGAVQASQSWGDILVLLGLGVLGWIMKQYGFVRPPLLVGFVLGPLAERYLWIAQQRYGLEWLTHPSVIVIGLMTAVSLWASIRYQRKRAASGGAG
ncbi:MAG: tripartite tricarboxylate transporter permease [Chloroflexota bacterium]